MKYNSAEVKEINQFSLFYNKFKNNQTGMIAFYIVILYVLVALLHPLFMIESPFSTIPGRKRREGGGANARPSLKYPFGVNFLGNDNFSRIISGAETSLMVGVLATLMALVIGVLIGVFAGFYQGEVENILMRITDVVFAIPLLFIIMIFLAFSESFTPNLLQDIPNVKIITLSIGLFGWAGLARLVASHVKQISSLEYIEAIKVVGASNKRIMWVHIFPNVLSSIIVLITIFIAFAITTEAALVFLGFGDPFHTISWGIDLENGYNQINLYPKQTLIPAFALFFLVLSINIVGDGIADALDPKLKD